MNDETVAPFDMVQFVKDHGQAFGRLSLLAAALAAIVGGGFFALQTKQTVVSVEFRPEFEGAALGEYPNKLKFGADDITAAAVVERVFERNPQLAESCTRDDFRAGLFVEQKSLGMAILDAEYTTRLADPRIAPMERTRLENEYRAKRLAVPMGFNLVLVQPKRCRLMPTLLISKALSDMLSVWAEDAEVKRGVLRFNRDILPPSVFDPGSLAKRSLLIRADILQSGLRRLLANITEIENLPGARLVSVGEKRLNFFEVKSRVEDLAQAGIEPLIVSAGRGLGADALVWVDEALETATREQRLAEGRVNALLNALREYSGVSVAAFGSRQELQKAPNGSSDVQTLTPQIDRTFIENIVALSEPNLRFRQEMTRNLVEASMAAVEQEATVDHYKHLADVLRHAGAMRLSREQVLEQLEEVAAEARTLTKEFNELYLEWSRVSLRTGPAMYQITAGTQVQAVRGYTFRDYLATVVAAFLGTLVLAVGFRLLRDRFKFAATATL